MLLLSDLNQIIYDNLPVLDLEMVKHSFTKSTGNYLIKPVNCDIVYKQIMETGNLPWLKRINSCHESVTCDKYEQLRSEMVSTLANNGHLKALKYARNSGYTWNEQTCANAAGNGHLEILVYARENGCPWDDWTCTLAAANNHIECLRYAHENGCSWNEKTCEIAAAKGHLNIIKYADKNGCPNGNSLDFALKYNQQKIIEYFIIKQYGIEEGCCIVFPESR